MLDSPVLFPLIALLAGLLLELLLGRVLSRTAKGWLAFAAGLAATAGAAALIPGVLRSSSLDVSLLDWDRGISLAYHVDGLSLIFILMAVVIGTAILLYCIRYMEHEPEGTTRFYALMLAFIAGLVQLVSSANLLVAYASWELIGLCSYFLVGFWYKENPAAKGARKVLLMTHLAGYALLAGILLLFARSGTLLWTDPALAAYFSGGIFLLFLFAAMAKSVVFPLHTWIPEAMNAPTPVSALLHSACYVKAGIYLIARLYSITPWRPEWSLLVLVLGCVTMLVGAAFALAQTDLKRLLAYSTISQLGHIVTALGLGTSLGISAALFYTISHGLFKGTLFLCAGAVQHQTGTRDLRKLGGLAGRMPGTAAVWLIAAAAIIGIPLTNGFVAKWLLLSAALSSGQVVVVMVTWMVSIMTAFYMLKATAAVFYGEMPAELAKRQVRDAAPSMKVGMALLAGLSLLFGLAPQLLIPTLIAPAASAMNFASELQVTWLGVQTGASGIEITLGAAIVLAAGLIGWLVYALSRPRKPLPAGTFTGGDPLPVEAGVFGAVDFTEMVESSAQPVYRFTDPDPLYRRGWSTLQAASSRLAGTAAAPLENHPLLSVLVGVVVVLLLVLVGG